MTVTVGIVTVGTVYDWYSRYSEVYDCNSRCSVTVGIVKYDDCYSRYSEVR